MRIGGKGEEFESGRVGHLVHYSIYVYCIDLTLSQELLGEMERGRSAQQENYWLIQYQKLLDTKPQGVLEAERNMDPQVSKMVSKTI